VPVLRAAAKSLFAAADLFLPTPKGPRILIYHQVGSGLGRQMEVSVDDFYLQLNWLAENRRVVDLESAVDRWQEPGSGQLVVLTFDDGYRDTFTTAFPRLRELAMPFSIYLATRSIETGTSLGPASGAEPLSWSQVEEMMESGLMTLGAHTHTHRDLRHAGSKEVEEELSTSNELITRRIGVEPRHFAYPWGYWSAVAESLLREGYSTAVLGGSSRPERRPSPYRLHRYPVQLSDGLGFFRARLRGGFQLEEWTRRKLREYHGP